MQKGTRERFMFWLDLAKDNEFYIAEMIAELKSTRRFTSTIRDGIRLICDLREGNLNVLFELFPWVRAEFLEYMASVQPQKSDAELVIAEHLRKIETVLLSDGNGPHLTSGGGGPKPMAVPLIPAPDYDEDEQAMMLTVKRSEGPGKQAAENFLTSAFSLQG